MTQKLEAVSELEVWAMGGYPTEMKRADGSTYWNVVRYYVDWVTVDGTGTTKEAACRDFLNRRTAPERTEA